MFWTHSFSPWLVSLVLLGLPPSCSNILSDVAHTCSLFLCTFSYHSCCSIENNAIQAIATIQKNETSLVMHQASLMVESPHIVAPVIFQSQTSWGNTLWIQAGNKTSCSFPIIKNCPVLAGSILIGIIDYVSDNASRVRLLSDPVVHPAVRIVRGNLVDQKALIASRELLSLLEKNPSCNPDILPPLKKLLLHLEDAVQQTTKLRLAKGELQGASSQSHLWRGVGFNYEVSDGEGPKRDLRTGQTSLQSPKIALLQSGDILETSGLDGFFPKGLLVATVEKVFSLEEGETAYQILAKSLFSNFPFFEYLTIIPALPQDHFSPPSQVDLIKDLIES